MKHDRSSLGMFSTLATLLILGVSIAQPAHGFSLTGVGGKLGLSTPSDFDGAAEVGVHAEFEQPGTQLHLLPSLLYWNVDHVRDLSPNLDVCYHFSPQGTVSPYVGGGLGLHFVRDTRSDQGSTDLGMNLIGGLQFPSSTNRYFIEGRYTASDITQVAVLGGVTFPIR